MRILFIFFCSLVFYVSQAQEQKLYVFYVELDHHLNAPKFKEENGKLLYIGSNQQEKEFFSNYTLLGFYQSFPDSKRFRTLNVFTVLTYENTLMNNLKMEFPSKYLRVEDISDLNLEIAETYTNDYGSTSPSPNLGVNADMSNYDYIGVPKAWDYTKGNNSVLIGISDAKIDTTDIDFKYKTNFLQAYYDEGFHNLPYNYNNLESSHGTGVTAIAAAQGDNEHGTTGICSDCSVLSTAYRYSPLSMYGEAGNGTLLPEYNRLLQLAISGVRVINMSWGYLHTTPIQTHQWIIDEIHEEYDVVLVAAAGNKNSFDSQYAPNYILYNYPASYNHVISVLTVNHKNTWGEETVIEPAYGEVSLYVKDMISPSVVTNYQNNGPYGFYSAHTTNEFVDICAPGYKYFRYAVYVGQGTIEYGGGATSAAAPHVTGTVGLMLSLNECLTSNEVENILKLTSKNLEHLQGNEPFIGRSGSGKLETGDSVEFVKNMMDPNGNAVVDGQDFYRFNFLLNRINNKLSISNQIFRDNCTADFTAKNVIEILPGCDFKPNSNGFVDLKLDDQIDVTCTAPEGRVANNKKASHTKQIISTKTILYPNPNNGIFEIKPAFEADVLSIEIYDVTGKTIFKSVKESNNLKFDVSDLCAGMYIVKLSSGTHNEIMKIIKQ